MQKIEDNSITLIRYWYFICRTSCANLNSCRRKIYSQTNLLTFDLKTAKMLLKKDLSLWETNSKIRILSNTYLIYPAIRICAPTLHVLTTSEFAKVYFLLDEALLSQNFLKNSFFDTHKFCKFFINECNLPTNTWNFACEKICTNKVNLPMRIMVTIENSTNIKHQQKTWNSNFLSMLLPCY